MKVSINNVTWCLNTQVITNSTIYILCIMACPTMPLATDAHLTLMLCTTRYLLQWFLT